MMMTIVTSARALATKTFAKPESVERCENERSGEQTKEKSSEL